MPGRLLLSRAAAIALRALVELAREPAVTLSVAELARRQQLPQPMLEQILLRLRRAGLVEARRGRHGGYRLAQHADALPLARVLQAVEPPRAGRGNQEPSPAAAPAGQGSQARAARPSATARRESPAAASAAGWEALDGIEALGQPGPLTGDLESHPVGMAAAEPGSLEASAGHRVEQQLRQRLERLLQQELQRLTLAELLYDQRSWEASLGPEGGVMMM